MPKINSDLFQIDSLLTADQRRLRDRIRNYVTETVRPNINPYWERAEFPLELVRAMTPLGIIGGQVQGYGCPGLDPLSEGLVFYELARGDGSISTFYAVQSGLAIGAIGLLGSDEQRQRWLPGLAGLDLIGAFGLTEPERGSDASHMLTTARREGDDYLLTGAKRWIGCASSADLLIILARVESGGFGGFVIEQPLATEGVEIRDIPGKISKRAILNADIVLDNVPVPAANRLPGCQSFRDITRLLTNSRYGIAWEAAGTAAGCFELALNYATEREQFGQPIAGFQLVQQKLVDMAAELSQIQLLSIHLSRLMAAGQLTPGVVAMAKYSNAKKARHIAHLARELFGGNGILLDHHIGRLFTDIEAVYTYEGASDINLLIAGRELTGINAIV